MLYLKAEDARYIAQNPDSARKEAEIVFSAIYYESCMGNSKVLLSDPLPSHVIPVLMLAGYEVHQYGLGHEINW